MKNIFIDGGHGTVALAIQEFIQPLVKQGIIANVSTLNDLHKKDLNLRAEAFSNADIVVLCLPEHVASSAADLVKEVNPNAKIIDTSAAHRCDLTWAYGLPELGLAPIIKQAQYVANPGCFATGCVLIGSAIRFLESEQVPVHFSGITGYSAAGRNASPKNYYPQLSQFGADHKHLPEIKLFGGVDPSLSTIIGSWERGMIVQTTVNHLADDVFDILHALYRDTPTISLSKAINESNRLSATCANHTGCVKIVVASNSNNTTTIAAAYDNLGKGSAAAVVQNIQLMI